VARVLGPDCQPALPGVQSSGTVSCSGEPSLWAVGVLGHGCCTVIRVCSTVVLLPSRGNQTCWLAPSVTHGAVGVTWVLLTQWSQFPCPFRVMLAGCVVGGAWSSKFLCVLGSMPSNGACSCRDFRSRVSGVLNNICSSHSSCG
jgi:hypothetical protein